MAISPADAHGLFADFKLADFKLAAAVDGRGKNMAEGNFSPAWELTMARKDVPSTEPSRP